MGKSKLPCTRKFILLGCGSVLALVRTSSPSLAAVSTAAGRSAAGRQSAKGSYPSKARRLASPQALQAPSHHFFRPLGMKSLVELPDPVAQSKQFVYMSQSIFEKSTAAFGIKEGFASSCAKSSALPSWPAMCVTQLRATAAFPNSPEQTKAADAGGCRAVACEAKRARRQGHAGGPQGCAGGGHFEHGTGHQLARQRFAASSWSFPGSARPSRSLCSCRSAAESGT